MKAIYTERGTSLLYEVQFFDEFVLVRHAGGQTGTLEKLNYNTFTERFDEFWGDQSALIADEGLSTTPEA